MPAGLAIEIFPSDLKKSLRFYTHHLGFSLQKDGGTYAYVKKDNIFIIMVESDFGDKRAEIERLRQPPTGFEIVIEVDDLEAERDALVAKRIKLLEDITLRSWAMKDFRLLDPHGYFLRYTGHQSQQKWD